MVAERGYDEVSVRDVAEALEISKGTILHHFRSKEACWRSSTATTCAAAWPRPHEFLAGFEDPVDQLQLIVYQLMLSQQDDRAATVAFAREIVRFAAEDADGRRAGDARPGTRGPGHRDHPPRGRAGAFADVDPSLAALQLFGMCNWSWTWFEPAGGWSATADRRPVLPHPDRRARRRRRRRS